MKSTDYKLSSSPFVRNKVPFIGIDSAFNIPSVVIFSPFVDNSRKHAGFTLIEMMVTVVIAVILMMIAGPSLSTFISNTRMTNQANELLADLNYARSEAIKRSVPVTVCKTANPDATSPVCNTTTADRWTAGRLIFVDGNQDGVVDAGEQILKIRQEIDGAGASGNLIMGFVDGAEEGTSNRVTFRANGFSHLVNQGELLSCDKRGNTFGLAVVIQTTGRVRVADKSKDKDGNNITACP